MISIHRQKICREGTEENKTNANAHLVQLCSKCITYCGATRCKFNELSSMFTILDTVISQLSTD